MVRAVVCRALGAPETLRLEEFPSRALKPGEVRVAIRAAGLNFPDVLMVAGEYQLKPELPFTPGMEAAGDVTEVGAEASGVAVGGALRAPPPTILDPSLLLCPVGRASSRDGSETIDFAGD